MLGAPHLACKEFAQALIDLLVRDTVTIMERILVSGQKVSAGERSPLFNIPFLRTDFMRQSVAVGAGVLLTLIGGIPIIEAVRQGLRSAPGGDASSLLNSLEPGEPSDPGPEEIPS